MVDLTDVFGANPLRTQIMKKREKVKARIEINDTKMKPFRDELEMYDKMLAAMDEKEGADTMRQLSSEVEEEGFPRHIHTEESEA